MNWGKGIILVYVLFVAGIAYLVYGATHTTFELVEENYYEKELAFQSQINWTKNAVDQKMKIDVQEVGSKIQISVVSKDSNTNADFTSASVWFYNAMDKSKDQHLELGDAIEGHWIVDGDLPKGHFEVKVRWNNATKDTFFAVTEFIKK